jgi:V/A-type H+/Na+-transporting ATPase subunit I
MIVPMKKYSFLVYHREYEQFLKQIQDLGVVHVIEKESGDIENEELNEQYAKIKEISNSIKFLEKRDVEPSENSEERDAAKVLSDLQNIQRTFDDAHSKLETLKKEIAQMEPWGEFKWENIFKLKKAGLKAKFFSSSVKVFEESDWKEKYYLEEISRKEGYVYFILFKRSEDVLEIDAEQLLLPTRPLSELKKVELQAEQVIAKSEELFDNYASRHIPLLKSYRDQLNGTLSFELVKLNTHSEAENKLMILEGWVPKDKIESLDTYLNSTGVYHERLDPEIKETPPIKLKNNKFARLYESIGELYTFPNYGEIDLTPFFAPFYMLFFGFCLGDAGYGLLITIGTIYGLFKVKDKLKPLLKLGMYLGIATTLMGIVGGTIFGIMLHPENFEAGRTFAPWLTKYQEFIVSSNNLMIVALVLGYIQVLFGMFLKAANKAKMYGFKHSISQFGWNTIVMVTIPAWALGNFEVIAPETGNMIALISGILGGLPAIFYNTPGKNPLLNLGVGLWDTYQTASGLLGDVLSYIRLFALGLSSAILGNVFNTLAMDLSPDIIVVKQIVMILILAFGHGLNFFMAALGSFVHPLRLTFVEFYKNAGFMGGGRKYEPFSKK